MEIVTITFTKWHEWNPRKDIKHPLWFAMSNRITEDDQIQTLTDREFRAFIHMFCLASQRNSDTAPINLNKAERVTGIKAAIFLEAIEKLCAFGICTRSDGFPTDSDAHPTDSRQNPSATLHNNTIQDTTEQAPPDLEFDSIYSEYPKRPGSGKGEGIKALSRQLHSPADVELCRRAAINYRKHCEQNKTEPQFIKQFKTWCGSLENPRWREWIDWTPTAVNALPGSHKGPPAIRYKSADEVLAETRSNEPDARGDAERAAKIRDMIAKTGNLGRGAS